MNIAQVFRWFCKEQRIMHRMIRMYHAIHPYKLEYVKLQEELSTSCIERYLTFDEYIDYKVNTHGFSFLLTRIIEDYMHALRPTMDYDTFWDLRLKMEEEFFPTIKKWEYFSRNNILLDNLKVGDKVYFRTWNGNDLLTIGRIKISEGRIYGTIKREDRDVDYCVRIAELENPDKTPMKYKFSIKRKRKIYYGKN